MDKFLSKSKRNEDQGEGMDNNGQKLKTIKQSGSCKRKYNEDYIGFGFIVSERDSWLPYRLICSTTLSNEAMVPSKLERHLTKNHPEHKDRPREHFEKLRSNIKKQSKKMKLFCSIPEKAQIASYKIARLLEKKKKPHAEAESIILPALEIAVESMISHEAVEQVKRIPLSSDTISRRIQDLSRDIDDQLKEHFISATEKINKLWTLQIDESTEAEKLNCLHFCDLS